MNRVLFSEQFEVFGATTNCKTKYKCTQKGHLFHLVNNYLSKIVWVGWISILCHVTICYLIVVLELIIWNNIKKRNQLNLNCKFIWVKDKKLFLILLPINALDDFGEVITRAFLFFGVLLFLSYHLIQKQSECVRSCVTTYLN